jgi:hypothetical protein
VTYFWYHWHFSCTSDIFLVPLTLFLYKWHIFGTTLVLPPVYHWHFFSTINTYGSIDTILVPNILTYVRTRPAGLRYCRRLYGARKVYVYICKRDFLWQCLTDLINLNTNQKCLSVLNTKMCFIFLCGDVSCANCYSQSKAKSLTKQSFFQKNRVKLRRQNLLKIKIFSESPDGGQYRKK